MEIIYDGGSHDEDDIGRMALHDLHHPDVVKGHRCLGVMFMIKRIVV